MHKVSNSFLDGGVVYVMSTSQRSAAGVSSPVSQLDVKDFSRLTHSSSGITLDSYILQLLRLSLTSMSAMGTNEDRVVDSYTSTKVLPQIEFILSKLPTGTRHSIAFDFEPNTD